MNITEKDVKPSQARVLQRIVRAYKNKIRRQLKMGESFSFWHVIGNIDHFKLVRHIEKHFQHGMTWANYGRWHLVNRHPLNGTIRTSKQFYEYFHYQNYHPTWLLPQRPPRLKNGILARQ